MTEKKQNGKTVLAPPVCVCVCVFSFIIVVFILFFNLLNHNSIKRPGV